MKKDMVNKIMVNKIADSIIDKVLKNGGRWCKLKMKKTGEELKVIRTGYRSFENFYKDSCNLVNEEGTVLVVAETPYGIAKYIFENYCK